MPERAEEQYLYLTTTGRKTGQQREIEIWFIRRGGKFYIFAEHFHKAQWVKNVLQNPSVRVRTGDRESTARARVLDPEGDRALWEETQAAAREKYGWGDGLPVELTLD